VIDPGVLEIDDEPIAARELDTDAQRSQLRDHLLGLPATLRENLVPPLLPGHGSRLVPNNDRRPPKGATEAAPPVSRPSIPRWSRSGGVRAHMSRPGSEGSTRKPLGTCPRPGGSRQPSSLVKASTPIWPTQLLHFGDARSPQRHPVGGREGRRARTQMRPTAGWQIRYPPHA
jgi:hypothetical protein